VVKALLPNYRVFVPTIMVFDFISSNNYYFDMSPNFFPSPTNYFPVTGSGAIGASRPLNSYWSYFNK